MLLFYQILDCCPYPKQQTLELDPTRLALGEWRLGKGPSCDIWSRAGSCTHGKRPSPEKVLARTTEVYDTHSKGSSRGDGALGIASSNAGRRDSEHGGGHRRGEDRRRGGLPDGLFREPASTRRRSVRCSTHAF